MSRRRRQLLLAGVGVLVLVAVAFLLQLVDDADALDLLDAEGSTGWRYLSIFLLVAVFFVYRRRAPEPASVRP